MLLGLNIIDKTNDEHRREIATLAESEDTLVFLDTNILAYLYKLHGAARTEFFSWADALVAHDRLRIPAWCAGEYLTVVRDGQLHSYTPKSREEDQPRKALETLLDTASLFVDDGILEAIEFPGGRSLFLSQFRTAIDNLKPYTRAFRHQFVPEEVHEDIQKHFASVVLDSDLPALCSKAAAEGPARTEHRIPPAFRDEGKTQNRLGDLIIWFEILNYANQTKERFNNVLFLTNDQKSDWVYAPSKRTELIGGKRRTVPNAEPRIRIADPRLVLEFRRLIGHERIAVCDLSVLIEGLSKLSPTKIGQLAAAIQINAGASDARPLSGTSTTEIAPPDVDATGSGQIDREAESTAAAVAVADAPDGTAPLTFPEDAYRDAAYEADSPTAINQIIRALKSHNWYTQNPAIQEIRQIRTDSFPPGSWFVLGRNIYQAACGNAQKALDFMVNLDIQLKRFPHDVAESVLAGIVFEIYFDGQGALRDRAKTSYLHKALAVVASPEFNRVRDFIRGRLSAAGAHFPFLPGDEKRLQLRIASAEHEDGDLSPDKRRLTSVTLEGKEILRDDAADDSWSWTRSSYSRKQLTQIVADSLAIPSWAIDLQLEPDVSRDVHFYVPDDKFLHPKAYLDGEEQA